MIFRSSRRRDPALSERGITSSGWPVSWWPLFDAAVPRYMILRIFSRRSAFWYSIVW